MYLGPYKEEGQNLRWSMILHSNIYPSQGTSGKSVSPSQIYVRTEECDSWDMMERFYNLSHEEEQSSASTNEL